MIEPFDGDWSSFPSDSLSAVETTLSFEKGVILPRSIKASPKLVLNYVHEEEVDDTGKMQVQPKAPCYIELCEVTQILDIEHLPSKICPFAERHTSFVIVTIHNFFIFEAANRNERNRLVFILKSIVAKFAENPMGFQSAASGGSVCESMCGSNTDSVMLIRRAFAVDEQD